MGTPPATPVNVTTSAVVRSAASFYKGACVRETAGAAAAVRIYDNASAASGTLLATISLPANGSHTDITPPGGVAAVNGIYWSVVSGTVEGTVRVG